MKKTNVMTPAQKINSLLALFLCFCVAGMIAQQSIELPGAEPVNPHEYADINGSPYLLESFTPGTLYGSNMTIYKDQLINYNGKTQMLEVKFADETYELAPSSYLRVEIETGMVDGNGKPGKMILQRGVHKRFENGFVRVVYRGRRIILVDNFKAEVDDSSTEQMGLKENFTRFMRGHDYYLKHHADLRSVHLHVKSLARILGHEDEIESFIQEKGLDVSKEQDVSRLLKWCEDKGFVR